MPHPRKPERSLWWRTGASRPAIGYSLGHADGPPAADSVLAGLTALPGISAAQRTAGGVRIETDDFGARLAGALQYIAGCGLRVVSVQTGQMNLEDVFISLTGHALRDGPPGGES